MKNKLKPTARRTNLVIQETGNEILVYDLSTNKAACLNEISAFVWQNCDGSNSIADIAQALGRKTNGDVNDELVWLAIDELSKHELIEEDISTNGVFGDMSRRQIIKKVGLGTMVALPLIATLIAPSALHAQSCLANNAPCTVSSQCCSTCCKDVGGGINQCKPGGGACLP